MPAGTYGLHAIPGEKEWTIILSTQVAALEKKGDAKAAAQLREKAIALAEDEDQKKRIRVELTKP